MLFSSASCQMCRIHSYNSLSLSLFVCVRCSNAIGAWTCEKHAQANRAANNLNQQNNNMNHMHSQHTHTAHSTQLDVCFCCSFFVVLLFRLAREQVALSFVIYPQRVCHAVKCKAHMKITYHTEKSKAKQNNAFRRCAFFVLPRRTAVFFSRFCVWWLFVVNLFPVAKKVAMHFTHFCDCI